jgi:hypothetical protein
VGLSPFVRIAPAAASFARSLPPQPRPWEAQFIENNLGRAWFTEKQKAVIDRLRTKWQSRL